MSFLLINYAVDERRRKLAGVVCVVALTALACRAHVSTALNVTTLTKWP